MTKKILDKKVCIDYRSNMQVYIRDLKNNDALAWVCFEFFISEISETLFVDYEIDVSIRKKLNRRSSANFLGTLRENKDFEFKRNYEEFKIFYVINYLNPEYYYFIYESNYIILLENLKINNSNAWNIFETISEKRVKNSKLRDVKNNDDKNNIVQETKIEFWKQLNKGIDMVECNSLSKLIGYFLGILHNKSIDYFRKNNKINLPLKYLDTITIGEDGEEIYNTDKSIKLEDNLLGDRVFVLDSVSKYLQEYSYKELLEKTLKECIQILEKENEELFNVLTLRYYQKWLHKEIASFFDISDSNSQNKAAKAVKILRECIKAKGYNYY